MAYEVKKKDGKVVSSTSKPPRVTTNWSGTEPEAPEAPLDPASQVQELLKTIREGTPE